MDILIFFFHLWTWDTVPSDCVFNFISLALYCSNFLVELIPEVFFFPFGWCCKWDSFLNFSHSSSLSTHENAVDFASSCIPRLWWVHLSFLVVLPLRFFTFYITCLGDFTSSFLDCRPKGSSQDFYTVMNRRGGVSIWSYLWHYPYDIIGHFPIGLHCVAINSSCY